MRSTPWATRQSTSRSAARRVMGGPARNRNVPHDTRKPCPRRPALRPCRRSGGNARMARWKRRPEGSTWGDFGPDDQLGRLNLITPKKVLEGIAEVKEGRTFCLSLPLELPGGNVLNPRRHPPKRYATIRGGLANYNYPFRRENPDWVDVVSDDAVLLHTQYSTQWDSFAHVGQEFDADGDGKAELVYYNGFRADSDVVAPPAKPGG